MHPISDLTDIIGTPFSEMKCWDVVVEVYRRSGIPLPEYTQIQMDEWREIREPMPGSVLVFALYGIEHISKYVPRLKHIYERKE